VKYSLSERDLNGKRPINKTGKGGIPDFLTMALKRSREPTTQ
jgi:hypothetical protein